MKSFDIGKGVTASIRSREKDWQHDARVQIKLEYGELLDKAEVRDIGEETEEEAQRLAQRIATGLKKFGFGEVSLLDNSKEFEGEITINVVVKEGHTPAEVIRRAEGIISVLQSEAGRAARSYKDRVRQERLSTVTSALVGFKGRTIDDKTIPVIAEGVVATLGKGRG